MCLKNSCLPCAASPKLRTQYPITVTVNCHSKQALQVCCFFNNTFSFFISVLKDIFFFFKPKGLKKRHRARLGTMTGPKHLVKFPPHCLPDLLFSDVLNEAQRDFVAFSSPLTKKKRDSFSFF